MTATHRIASQCIKWKRITEFLVLVSLIHHNREEYCTMYTISLVTWIPTTYYSLHKTKTELSSAPHHTKQDYTIL